MATVSATITAAMAVTASAAGIASPAAVTRATVWTIHIFILGSLLSTEDIQLVDEVDHEVGIDGIGPGVATHHGIDCTAHIALLLQDIVELQADSSRLVLQETLGKLGIPEEFVVVHGSIGESTT